MKHVIIRAYWHMRGRCAQEDAQRARRRYIALCRRAEEFFRRRDGA